MSRPHAQESSRAVMFDPTMPCPCGRADFQRRRMAYAGCCGRYVGHFAESPAPDAENLMRSRYTAFVTASEEYLLATWHVDRRPSEFTMSQAIKWHGLDVRSVRQATPNRAEVEFVARYSVNGRAARLQETSNFVLEGGRWYYVGGRINCASWRRPTRSRHRPSCTTRLL